MLLPYRDINLWRNHSVLSVPWTLRETCAGCTSVWLIREGDCLGFYNFANSRQYHIAREASMAVFDFILTSTNYLVSQSFLLIFLYGRWFTEKQDLEMQDSYRLELLWKWRHMTVSWETLASVNAELNVHITTLGVFAFRCCSFFNQQEQ